jgi:hypothetical protein
MLTLVIKSPSLLKKSTTNDPLAEPKRTGQGNVVEPQKVTFDSVKVTKVSALAAVDPAYAAMIEDAASVAISFGVMAVFPLDEPPQRRHERLRHSSISSIAVFWTKLRFFGLRRRWRKSTRS